MTEPSRPSNADPGNDNAPTTPVGASGDIVRLSRPTVDELARVISAGQAVDLGGTRVEADVLRRLIIGQVSDCRVTPLGVRLRNGEIVGRLDLEGTDIPFPLVFTRIVMQAKGQNGSIVLRDARIRRLNISNSTIVGSIVADRAEFENGVIVAGGRSGALLVRGANIGGALSIEGTHFGDTRAAILAAGARISGPLVLRRARALGEVRLQRSHLGGGLRADELQVTQEGSALHCDAAQIAGDVQLNNAMVAGPVRFTNASVDGSFTAKGMTVEASQAGFNAAGLNITQTLDLSHSKIIGPLNLEGANIAKRLLAEAISIDGGETAIGADIVHVGGNWEMPRARLVGQVRCPGARIGGQLRCTAARFFGGDLALRADGAQIAGGVYFSRAVVSGGLRFPAAIIHNQFRFSGATIKVEEGPALLASGATLHRDAELDAGFQSIGAVIFDQSRIHGNCNLTMSRIKSAAVVRSANGPSELRASEADTDHDEIAVSFVDASVDRLEMPARADERPRGVVDFSRTRVGAYVDWQASWPPSLPTAGDTPPGAPDHLVLDGFAYEHLENPAGLSLDAEGAPNRRERVGARRISWLLAQASRDVNERFKPQPWVYLSKQLTAQGLDRDARKVTIERRRRERLSHWSTPSARWESRFLDWFALYGFNPWRTVVWMSAVVLLFACVWAWGASNCSQPGCFDERVFVTSKRDAFSSERFKDRYPAFHPLAYSFDVFVPFVSFGYESHWRPNMGYGPLATWSLPHIPAFVGGATAKDRIFADVTITTGGILYVLVILQKILGLILTSLMLTGFTGLLRSHE